VTREVTNRVHPVARRAAELLDFARSGARLLLGARMTDGQGLSSLQAQAEAALLDGQHAAGLPSGWRLGNRLTTVADVAVLEVVDRSRLVAVLKLSRSAAGDASLLLQLAVLDRLHADPRLGGWRRLLPTVLARGRAAPHHYSIEGALPGVPGDRRHDAPRDGLIEAAGLVGELHRATGRPAAATPSSIDGWTEPALSLLGDVPMLLGPGRRREIVDALRHRLREALEGRTVWVGCTHGDYSPGNILFDGAGRVGGIVDWAQARDDDLVLLDPMTLLLFERAHVRGIPFGRIVVELLAGAPLSSDEAALLEAHRSLCPADPLPVPTAALLAWLRHVETNLVKSARYAHNPVWVCRNVEPVLRAIGRTERGRDG
jgi:Ser/Thr protein kinase RdoA (MazF antagonist)